jgi:dolichol-phosphate mannosyltransferase
VTGAAGFVGANLARRLLKEGHDVALAVRPGSDLWRLDDLPGPGRIVEIDVESRDQVRDVVRELAPKWVFNLAAYGAYSTQTDTSRMVATNVVGTANLLEAAGAHGCTAFVQAGSSSEYGFKDHPPAESEVVEPNSWYAVTKASATLQCVHAGRSALVPTMTLRLYSAFGPWEEPTRLMPTFVLAAREGQLPPLVSPDVARDFVYVDDIVDAFVLAAEHAGDFTGAIYNVGSGTQTSMSQLVETVRSVLGVRQEPRWGSMPNRTWDTAVWIADASRIRADLGWRPRIGVDEGVRLLADWLDDDRIRAGYEARREPPA